MRVLYATLRPPFPPKLGDQLIAWEQITRVAGSVELYVLNFGESLEDESLLRRQLAPFCRGLTVMRAGRDRRRMWRSLVRRTPYLVELFHDPRLHLAVREHIRAVAPDVVHVQSVHIAEYFNECPVPKVIDLVDTLSTNMARRVASTRWPVSYLYQREARLLHRYEAAVVTHYQQSMLVARADAVAHPGVPFRINPNGTRITATELARHPRPPTEEAIVFHGNMAYAPNVDAARFLARDVMPRLRTQHPHLKLYLVGFDPVPAVRELADGARTLVTGAVPDVVPYLTRCRLGVYPLRAGSGMPNKVLDALACGLPSIVSPRVLAALEHARDGEHLRVATDAASWASTITTLLADAPARAALAAQGQAMVQARYTWEENVARLLDTWRAAIRRTGHGHGSVPSNLGP